MSANGLTQFFHIVAVVADILIHWSAGPPTMKDSCKFHLEHRMQLETTFSYDSNDRRLPGVSRGLRASRQSQSQKPTRASENGRLGLAYLCLAWLAFWPRAKPRTPLPVGQ